MTHLSQSRPASVNAWRGLVLWASTWVLGCGVPDQTPTTAFRGPVGMVLAGSQFDRVFVANTGADTLQVVRLAPELRKIDLEPGPARYFPLNIPIGPNPKEVAASFDGRFVFALDAITGVLRLVEADAARLARDAQGAPITLALGPADSEPSGLVGAPWPCVPSEADATSRCLGRAYVGLKKLNLVAAVDVRERLSDRSLLMQLDSTAAVGAAPAHLAAHPITQALFVTDAQEPYLVRLTLDGRASLAQAEVTRSHLEMPGGAVSVSGDGRVVAVARPAYQDVLFFSGAQGDVSQGALVPLDANPVRTPTPRCIAACNLSAPDLCIDAHPADRALCASDVGYANSPYPYTAIYLGSTPTALAAISKSQTGEALSERCDAQAPEIFDEAFAVSSLDGTVELIGLTQNAEGQLGARLLDRSSCLLPSIKSDRLLADVLAPCAPLPEGRARMACLKDSAEGDDEDRVGRVALMRGTSHAGRMALTWEGILPHGDRMGGGAIDELGRLYDAGKEAQSDLSQVPIMPARTDARGDTVYRGDIVEIRTAQLANGPCGQEGTSDKNLCQLERRVVAVQKVLGRTRLTLDRPLSAACFSPGVQLAYRVRAGDMFMAAPIDAAGARLSAPTRLAPGETYGAGGLAGATDALSFTVLPELDVGSALSACELYDVDGSPKPTMPTWRSRRGSITFSVSDPSDPVRLGQLTDVLRNTTANSGKMPFAMVMTRATGAVSPSVPKPAALLVSFAGSDTLLVSAPSQLTAQVRVEAAERVLR